jgi:hypothetical protein
MTCPHADGNCGHVVPPHGTRARYVSRFHACRCAECREANRVYMAGYRSLAREPVPTRRPAYTIPAGWRRM